MMGYVNKKFDNPIRNVFSNGESIKNGQKTNTPIHACQLRTTEEFGIIFLDGALKLKENTTDIPEILEYSLLENQMNKYDNLICTSKAYFVNHGESLAIFKQGTTITIEIQEKDYRSRQWIKRFPISITSTTDKEFNCDDFKIILSIVERLQISDNLRMFIISELKTYINIHDENQFDTLNKFTLEPFDFEKMLEYIKQSNLTELVEKGLETISETFNISMEKLLGENAPNQLKGTSAVKKLEKEEQ